MTVFESSVVAMAKALVRDVQETQDFDALLHRITIGLVQARALECRQIGTSIIIRPLLMPLNMANGLADRSSKLEALGMRMATTWPPPEEGWPAGKNSLHLVKNDELEG